MVVVEKRMRSRLASTLVKDARLRITVADEAEIQQNIKGAVSEAWKVNKMLSRALDKKKEWKLWRRGVIARGGGKGGAA